VFRMVMVTGGEWGGGDYVEVLGVYVGQGVGGYID